MTLLLDDNSKRMVSSPSITRWWGITAGIMRSLRWW
jgi:hypothetical protein